MIRIIPRCLTKFCLVLGICFLSEANAGSDLEVIYKGKAGQAAESIRQQIRESKSPDRLPDLILIDTLRNDIDEFSKDYAEFYELIFDTLNQRRAEISKWEINSKERQEAENYYRRWLDFSSFVVNHWAYIYSEEKNSWVPGVGPIPEGNKKVGIPDPLWAALNTYSEAMIYYSEKKYIQAEVKSHSALSYLFLVDPNTLGGQVVLSSTLEYFHSISSDRRMTELFAEMLISKQRSKDPIQLNPYTSTIILELIRDSSIDSSLPIVKNPELIASINPDIDIHRNHAWIDNLDLSIVTKAIEIYLSGEQVAAKEYLERNRQFNEASISYELASGILYQSKEIPSSKLDKSMSDYLSYLEKKSKDSYAIAYTKFFRSLLNAVGEKNKGNKSRSDAELLKAITSLYWIANLEDHHPGTTLPAIFRNNRILLDCFMLLVIDSKLSEKDKSKAIETISSLSLVSSEYEYVNALDLVDNTQSSYGKNLAIQYESFVSKRESAYRDLFKTYLNSKPGDFISFTDDFLGIQSLNLQLDNLLTYIQNKKLALRSKKSTNRKIEKNSILVNAFCLEAFCYSYKKKSDGIAIGFEKKEKVIQDTSNFLNAIKNGHDGKNESVELVNFIFPDNKELKEIKNCHIVLTSGLSLLPMSLLTVNENYFIDSCNINNFTSLQHFERFNSKDVKQERDKWALSLADPIIRNKKEISAIDETLKMIRGGSSLADMAELPETELEAKAIIGNKDKQSTLLTRDLATKELLFSEDLSNYHILSFSSHGLMAGETLENLTPAILLSPSEKGSLLSTNDILDLNGAPSLIVLAICNASTPSSSLLNNEITSVANAFLMKGSDSVVSTLWPLNSKASVNILENAFKLHKKGFPISEAIQLASIEYRKDNINSPPKEWGAFIVFGNTFLTSPQQESNLETGLAVDMAIKDNHLLVISHNNAKIHVDVWDKSTLKLKSKINLEGASDAKFTSSKESSILLIKDKFLSYRKLNDSAEKIQEICKVQINDYWRINSLMLFGNKLFSVLNGRTDSNTIVNLIDLDGCKSSSLSFDLKVKNKFYDRSIVTSVGGDPTIIANSELDNSQDRKWENNYTYSGVRDYCQFQWGAVWNKVIIKDGFKMSFVENTPPYSGHGENNYGFILPYHNSHNPLSKIKYADSCSSRSKLVNFSAFFKDPDGSEFQQGDGPWSIFDYFLSDNLTIQNESFFSIFDKKSTWRKLTHENDISLNVVSARIGDNIPNYLGTSTTCQLLVGTEKDGTGYVACSSKDGYKLKIIH